MGLLLTFGCFGVGRLTGVCFRTLNSIIFEIRFPPSFPLAPPFFRIITPRFLPFIQGGGGHVTGGWWSVVFLSFVLTVLCGSGGSICMDLLTSDGELLFRKLCMAINV